MRAAPRFAPRRAFPPYAYITGRAPHPRRDPLGHSYGAPEPPPAPFDPARWRECEDYLYGVDLFNAGYYWEAHEAWEGLWRASRAASRARAAPATLFLQALIKLAAAGFKARQGRPEGVRRHAGVAAALLGDVGAATREFMGVRAADLAARAAAIATLDGPGLAALCRDDAILLEISPR